MNPEKWYFSIVDVCGVLTESKDPTAYWRKLKQRLKAEGNETVTNCHGLKLRAADGKMRLTDWWGLMIILISFELCSLAEARDSVIWWGRTETEGGSPIFIDGCFQKMKIEKILHPSPLQIRKRLNVKDLWEIVIKERCEHSLKRGVLVCWCTYQKPFQKPIGGWKAVSGILEVLTTFVKAVSTFSEVVTTFEKVVTAFAKIVTTLMTRYAFSVILRHSIQWKTVPLVSRNMMSKYDSFVIDWFSV